MDIKYSKKIDKEIFKEINRMGRKISPIFGYDFPKVKFDERLIPIAKSTVNVAKNYINEKKIQNIMKKIYNKKVPDITIYVNTTPFSTWNVEEKWVSVSIFRIGIEFYYTVCHEINHFMYDYVFKTKKYEDTKVKEIITVFNNIFDIKDRGWAKFKEEREKAIKHFKKSNNFRETIKYIKNAAR